MPAAPLCTMNERSGLRGVRFGACRCSGTHRSSARRCRCGLAYGQVACAWTPGRRARSRRSRAWPHGGAWDSPPDGGRASQRLRVDDRPHGRTCGRRRRWSSARRSIARVARSPWRTPSWRGVPRASAVRSGLRLPAPGGRVIRRPVATPIVTRRGAASSWPTIDRTCGRLPGQGCTWSTRRTSACRHRRRGGAQDLTRGPIRGVPGPTPAAFPDTN